MPASLVNTVWDNYLPAGGGVRTNWDPPASTTGTSTTGIPVGAVTATNQYTGPTGGYGYGYDPYGGGGAAATLPSNTAKSNLGAASDITQLTQLINQLNAANQKALNESRLGTQGQQIQANLLANTERESAGLLDPQTEAMLQQGIAQGGAADGFGVDSTNLAAAYRRALGETIEGTEAQAQKQYLDLLAANPSAPLYNASESLVTPGQYSATAAAQAQRQIEQQRFAQQALQFEAELAAQQRALARRGGGGGGVQSLIPQSTRDMSWFYERPGSTTENPFGLVGGGGTGNEASDGGLTYEDWMGYMDPDQEYDWYAPEQAPIDYSQLYDYTPSEDQYYGYV